MYSFIVILIFNLIHDIFWKYIIYLFLIIKSYDFIIFGIVTSQILSPNMLKSLLKLQYHKEFNLL